jgi:hypothetical protein
MQVVQKQGKRAGMKDEGSRYVQSLEERRGQSKHVRV